MARIDFVAGGGSRPDAIVQLFRDVFTASAGAAEGGAVGGLAEKLLEGTPPEDLYVFSAIGSEAVIGCIMFSRVLYEGDSRAIFILSPVAIDTARQRRGIGQRLLRHGLARLRESGVDAVLTYGDPAYYGRLGFAQVTVDFARPPFPLSQPHGWQARSLSDAPLAPMTGAVRCVDALNDPALW